VLDQNDDILEKTEVPLIKEGIPSVIYSRREVNGT
jgi:hypothetical protein